MKPLFALAIICFSCCIKSGAQTVTGTGTINYVPKFTGTSVVGNSTIYDNGTNVGVGTTTPAYKFDVNGNIRATSSANMDISAFGSGSTVYIRSSYYNRTNNFGVLPTVNDIANGASLGYVDNFTAGWAGMGNVNRSTGIAPGTYDVFVRIRTNGAGNAPTSCGFGIYDATAGTYPITTVLTSLSTNYQEVYGGRYVLTAAMLSNVLVTFFSSAGITTNYYLDYVKLVPAPIFSGNVLIGTTTDNGYKLDVNGTGRFTGPLAGTGATLNTLSTNSDVSGFVSLGRFGPGQPYSLLLLDPTSLGYKFMNGAVTELMTIQSTGNIGIGTTTPAYKLDVNGSLSASQIKYAGSVLSANANNVWIGQTNLGTEDPLTNSAYFFGINPRMGAERVLVVEARTADGAGAIVFKSGNNGTGATVTGAPERMRLSTYGNLLLGTATDNATDKLQVNGSGNFAGNLYCSTKVYIGTPDANTTTRIANYALAVNGNAIFNKAKVMLYTTPWADYVFEDNYTMLTLPQLDKFIQQNKHLPDMPTTAEVKENGIDLGDTQAKLLQKIEELTLYMIEQNKKMEQQRIEINNLKKQVTLLQKSK